jgi:hypothetical protein
MEEDQAPPHRIRDGRWLPTSPPSADDPSEALIVLVFVYWDKRAVKNSVDFIGFAL